MTAPRSEALFERARRVIPGGVNSPVRAFQSVGGTPYFVTRGQGALVFDVDGTTLRVTTVPQVIAAGYTVLGWVVASIDDAVRDLHAAGIAFERYEGMPQDDRGVWQAPNGARVAWFKDPDGNTLSVTQH